MKSLNALAAAVATAVLCFSVPLLAAIQLVPIVSSGLSSPLFVGHAGDGSDRLFIVERGGIIKVLQPGSSVPTVFLDIHTNVVAGGEQGLLGLAFHPLYEMNGRFFVFYTRSGDGTLVIAEYGLTSINVADPLSEQVVLTIPHPTNTNHNGGMLAFGPDGYLYIGVGDGGSGNDPPNNAQNLDVLLGKILRIDVDSGAPYVSPPTNPFIGMGNGRDEIYAYGLRNPWRFSFDRDFPQPLWVADVGQGAREEVDTPIVSGGNYGWRVYEGSACTNNDPALCIPSNYILPVFDYLHSGGRCSITGGYVYRGSQGALPDGRYVYGDYCSGEIFSWNGASQVVELDTTMNISSFGEDEAGEIYVVNLGGSVSKIVSTTPPCTYGVSPSSESFGANGGPGSVNVTAGPGCPWTAVANAGWIQVTSGASGTGNGAVQYSVDANASTARSGTITIAGQTFTVNQSAAATCTFSISPTSASYTRAGGSASVTVTAPTGCGWTAASNVSWMTVSPLSGSGSGSVTYTVGPYGGPPKKRTGTLTIAGQTFSVQQTK